MTDRQPTDQATLELAAARLQSGAAKRSRLIGFAIGLVLIGAAVFALLRQQGALTEAWSSLTDAPPSLLVLAAALPALGLVVTSTVFWLLTTRYGRVTFAEMLALLSSAWLLNYLPLWPGMIGRLAYHKTVNGIQVRDSAKALIWANVLNVLGALIFLATALVGIALIDTASPMLLIVTGTPIVGLFALAAWAHAVKPEADPHVWRSLGALGVRLVEQHVWAARFAICFALVGVPIAWGSACLIAALTALAIAIPITGNSLGVREWAVGAIAWLLPASIAATGSLDWRTGLEADLLNRALELALAIPLGLISAAWLARRVSRFKDQGPADPQPTT